jgi:hypothetical protein
MDTKTAKQLTSAVRYAIRLDKAGRPRDRPLTVENEAQDARENYSWLRAIYHGGRLRRQKLAMAEINGTGCRRSEDECECGRERHHVRLIVTRNGQDISGPMCPWAIAIRRLRLDVAEGQESNPGLLAKLLEEAAI